MAGQGYPPRIESEVSQVMLVSVLLQLWIYFLVCICSMRFMLRSAANGGIISVDIDAISCNVAGKKKQSVNSFKMHSD